MQFSTILSLAASLALTTALPTGTNPNPPSVPVTFIGAAGAQYTIDVKTDNTPTFTNNVLSISQVSSSYDLPAHCSFDAVDYTPALVLISPDLWNVGPPQTIISITCSGTSPPNPVQYVSIEFDGAADAKYSLSVPLNGAVIATNNALSISNIVTTYANLPNCNIVYVDLNFPAALVNTAPNTWSVGPPQTVQSIQCFA